MVWCIVLLLYAWLRNNVTDSISGSKRARELGNIWDFFVLFYIVR